jgi:hypothetical protein
MKQKHKDWLIKNKITSLEELVVKLGEMRHTTTAFFSEEKQMYFDFVYFIFNKEAVLSSFFRENILSTHCNTYREITPHIKFTILEQNTMTDNQQEKVSRNHLSTRHKASSAAFHLDEVLEDIEKKEQKVFEQLEDKTDRAFICFERKEKIKKKFSNAGEKAGIKESQAVKKAPIFTYCKVNRNALEALSLRALYGHIKYGNADVDWQNFTRVPNGDFEYTNAQFRHALDIGEEDEETHLIASAWNAVARLEIFLREKTK